MMLPLRLTVSIVVLLAISGCNTLTATGAYEGLRSNMLESDPAGIVAGVAVPTNLVLRPDAGVLVVEVVPDDTLLERTKDRFTMVPLDQTQAAAKPDVSAGEQLYLSQLSVIDAQRLRNIRARVQAMKQLGQTGTLLINVSINPEKVCYLGEKPVEPTYKSYLRTSRSRPIVQLTKPQPFFADQSEIDKLNLCEGRASE